MWYGDNFLCWSISNVFSLIFVFIICVIVTSIMSLRLLFCLFIISTSVPTKLFCKFLFSEFTVIILTIFTTETHRTTCKNCIWFHKNRFTELQKHQCRLLVQKTNSNMKSTESNVNVVGTKAICKIYHGSNLGQIIKPRLTSISLSSMTFV